MVSEAVTVTAIFSLSRPLSGLNVTVGAVLSNRYGPNVFTASFPAASDARIWT
jgi:hypothetical protein